MPAGARAFVCICMCVFLCVLVCVCMSMRICVSVFACLFVSLFSQAEVGRNCTEKSQCAADECCQIINIVVASRKRQLYSLRGPNTSGKASSGPWFSHSAVSQNEALAQNEVAHTLYIISFLRVLVHTIKSNNNSDHF